MRTTKLVVDSTEGFADAAKQLITKALSLSGNVKSLRIVEDRVAAASADGTYRLKAHLRRRS